MNNTGLPVHFFKDKPFFSKFAMGNIFFFFTVQGFTF
jgi:hypothetical protein